MKVEDFPKRIALEGLPHLGWQQLSLLIALYDESSRDTQQPLRRLSMTVNQKHRSLPPLEAGGYVVGDGREAGYYRLTPPGVKLLQAIQKRCRPRRDRNLCAECKAKPRMRTRRGLEAYCYDCHLAQNRRRYQLKMYKPADTPCSRCKRSARHIRPNGFVATYCADCLTLNAREQEEKRQAKRRHLIESGQGLKCRQCDAPVYVTEALIYDRCEAHQKAKWSRTRRHNA